MTERNLEKENNNNKASERDGEKGAKGVVVVEIDRGATEQDEGDGVWAPFEKEAVIDEVAEVVGDEQVAESFVHAWEGVGPARIRGWLKLTIDAEPDRPAAYLSTLAKRGAVPELGKKGGAKVSPEVRARQFSEEQADLQRRLAAGQEKARAYYSGVVAAPREEPRASAFDGVSGFLSLKAVMAKSLGKKP